MRWKGSRRSTNFEDRRGMSGGGKLVLGGVGGVIVLLIGLFLGGDPQQLLEQIQATDPQPTEPVEITAEEAELTEFVQVVLASTEDVWGAIYATAGQDYRPPTLVLYRDGTQTGGCGMGASAYGPFYCPADEKVYIDLDFNDELRERFGATGEFAMAYVLAHEVGHHIQKLTGAMDRVQAARQQLGEVAYNRVQVMLELQADFYAGVWAHHANNRSEVKLEYNDIRDGMEAAAAVGDDRLQLQAQGRVTPEAFTHGTSEQRAYWFKRGYDTGDVNQGDTFNDPRLQ